MDFTGVGSVLNYERVRTEVWISLSSTGVELRSCVCVLCRKRVNEVVGVFVKASEGGCWANGA